MGFQKSSRIIGMSLLMIFTLSFALDISITSYNQNYETQKSNNLRAHDEVMRLFEKWLFSNHKVYNDLEEKKKRFEIFKDNLRFIDEQNSKNETYKLGLNKFADLTLEEFSSIYLGMRIDDAHYNKTFKSSNMYEPHVNDNLPKSVDWRKKNVVTGVKDQDQCGSCWAFSAVATVEGINKIVTGNLISLSEQEVLDCENPFSDGCKGGFPENAFKFIIKNGGIDTDRDYPYKAVKGKCNQYKKGTKIVTIDSYGSVPTNNEKALEKAIANQPVSVLIEASEGFQLYKSGVYTGRCGRKLNHAVTVVGYGTTKKGQQYWLIKNSWGTNWGEKGYLRLQRSVQNFGGKCGITLHANYPIKRGRRENPSHYPINNNAFGSEASDVTPAKHYQVY